MKGTINVVKDAVHWHFNDQQGCKRIFVQTSHRPAACEFSRGRFDVWSCILLIMTIIKTFSTGIFPINSPLCIAGRTLSRRSYCMTGLPVN